MGDSNDTVLTRKEMNRTTQNEWEQNSVVFCYVLCHVQINNFQSNPLPLSLGE